MIYITNINTIISCYTNDLGPLVPVADLPGRRTLRSAGTNRLLEPGATC